MLSKHTSEKKIWLVFAFVDPPKPTNSIAGPWRIMVILSMRFFKEIANLL
jgi:hypothetical protein